MRHTLLAISLTFLSAIVPAQTLRWTDQGDLQTVDPHSQNEIPTNSLNGQIYEYLGRRMNGQAIGPALATEWIQVTPLLSACTS